MSDAMKHASKIFFLFPAALLALAAGGAALAQPPVRPPANVGGRWTIHSRGADGRTATQFIQLNQNGNTLTGHFKGPHQSGGLEGTINQQHIVFHTKTREVLNFRGRVEGDTMQGDFGIRGRHGTWQASRSN